DRKSTRLNSSHGSISYAVFCLQKKLDSFPHTQGNPAFHLPTRPLQSKINLLAIHGAEGVGSDRSAHLSAARGRLAGDAVHAVGRQGGLGRPFGQEVTPAFWGRARAAHVRPSLLRGSRAAGFGAAGFL